MFVLLQAIHDLEAGMAEEMEEKQQRLKERKRARTEADEDGKEDVVQGYKEEGAGKEDEDEAMVRVTGIAAVGQQGRRGRTQLMDAASFWWWFAVRERWIMCTVSGTDGRGGFPPPQHV